MGAAVATAVLYVSLDEKVARPPPAGAELRRAQAAHTTAQVLCGVAVLCMMLCLQLTHPGAVAHLRLRYG